MSKPPTNVQLEGVVRRLRQARWLSLLIFGAVTAALVPFVGVRTVVMILPALVAITSVPRQLRRIRCEQRQLRRLRRALREAIEREEEVTRDG